MTTNEVHDLPVLEPPGADQILAEALNAGCFCTGLDERALARALEDELDQPDLSQLLRERCPYVFAARPVFVAAGHLQRMAGVVRAVESVVALPAWRERVLAGAPDIARHAPGVRGVFHGYDFHLSGNRLALIEVNTNAGGAMLNAVLARAHRACCTPVETLVPGANNAQSLEQRIVDMFRAEWHLGGLARPLQRIAIVDEVPAQQYLYPEFLLFQRLFQRHGIAAVIADPSALHWRDGALWHDGDRVDLVYNRLTDFYLTAPSSVALREAYLRRGAVVTPHPQGHALYADKRNLAWLTDPVMLQALNVAPDMRRTLLTDIPRTELVTAGQADRLWSERRGLFFKPRAGFGSRAAYRGDKVTKRVWSEILAGDYVAQAVASPGQRAIGDAANEALKFDLRAYVYDGAIQWVAARLYQGQTTNFRTPGGGFAPVYAALSGCPPFDRTRLKLRPG